MIDDLGMKIKSYQDCIQVLGLQDDLVTIKDQEMLQMHKETVHTYKVLETYAKTMHTLRTTPFMQVKNIGQISEEARALASEKLGDLHGFEKEVRKAL